MIDFGAQEKAAPPALETPTGPSRKTSTAVTGGDGLMTHPTRKTPPSDTLDGCPCPYCDVPPRIGDLLPGVLAEMRRREAER